MLEVDARWIVQVVLCSALLTCIACVSFRRNAVTRRAYALAAGLTLAALPFALAAISGWHWTAPFDALRHLSLAGAVPVPIWLAAAWVGVAACLNGAALMRLIRARGELAALPAQDDPRIEAEAADIARRLAFKRPYRLHVGAAACSSSMAGDRIVLPAEARDWSPEALRAVLAHEFVHLVRRDDLALFALRLILHWYWFAPWVGLLGRHCARAMEQSCDDRAAECLPSCAAYLEGVLGAVRPECAAPSIAAPSIAAALGGSEAVARFERFLGIRERQIDAGGMYWGLLVGVGAALLCTSVEFQAARPPPSLWPLADLPGARMLGIGETSATMPRVRETALAGPRRAIRRDFRPIYPGRALNDGIEGHVVVEFRVARDGRVVRPAVLASEPPGVFDAAAVRAVAMREYEPSPIPSPLAATTATRRNAAMVRRFEFRLPTPDARR